MCHRSWVRSQTCPVVNKISFKSLVYTLCEDKSPGCAIPSLILSVCLFTCVYMMLVALSMCLRVGAGSVGGSLRFQ